MFNFDGKKLMSDIVQAKSGESLNLKKTEQKPEQKIEKKHHGLDSLVSEILSGDLGHEASKEIEQVASNPSDHLVELASIGVQVVPHSKTARPRYRPVLSRFNNHDDELHRKIIDRIREPILDKHYVASSRYYGLKDRKEISRIKEVSEPRLVAVPEPKPEPKLELKPQSQPKPESIKTPIKPELEAKVISFFKPVKPVPAPKPLIKAKALNFHTPVEPKRRFGIWIFLLLAMGLASYGFALRSEVLRDGATAFNNLEEAGDSLKNFNFSGAAENFGKSYQDFAQVSQTMNFMGAGLVSVFGDIPGFGKVKSAKDLVETGKLISQSGQAMSEALSSLSQTGAILNPADKNKVKPSKIISKIKDALILSDKNFQQAKILLAGIDESVIPEDKRQNLADFKDKLPLLEEYLGNAIEYSEFLEGVVGIDKPKKYLLLFQNSSELRPAGGFPGTYGVVSFASGGLSDFFVNDVYNLDGQLKRNVIPPKQLQHITPTWGMRDSAWFIDFPASAKKAMSFFSEEAGYPVNGVISLNPDIVSGILEVVGPIEMPEYDMTLTADNFLASIQEEVEYGENRTQPKSVVVDFAPLFLEKLYSADSEKWMKIFNVLMASLEEGDMQFYFDDKGLETFAVEEDFGGEVKNIKGDYLTVNFSNVKGSKTDAVTDSSISIDTRFENGKAIHRVTVIRHHQGGDHEHGFYNRQNPAYVRVLVPENAQLLNIYGYDRPKFKPLINYSLDGSFDKDRDLTVFESMFVADSNFPGVERFSESGKDGIGFWMITDPTTTKKVEFEYSVPLSGKEYGFYFQKQSGLDWKNFSFKLIPSAEYSVAQTSPALNRIADAYVFDTELKKDFDLRIKFK